MQLFMIEVRVSDWGRALAWYTGVLGLRTTLVDEARRFALLDADGGRIALKAGLVLEGRDAFRLTFRVGDVDAERDRLVRLGIDVSEPEDDESEGYRLIRLADPDGTPIGLFSSAD